MSKKFDISQYFNLKNTDFPEIFKEVEYPWGILPEIKKFILGFPPKSLEALGYRFVRGNIWVKQNTIIQANLEITGPVLIGEGCKILEGATIRPNTIIGDNVKIGNRVEVKNSFIFSNVEIPHACYIGNAIIGSDVYISVGVTLANRYDSLLNGNGIRIALSDGNFIELEKGDKFSALIGDGSHINPTAVINAGTIIGKKVSVFPLTTVKGFVPSYHVVKKDGSIEKNRNFENGKWVLT